MIRQNSIQTILDTVPIEGLIGEYVSLKKRGSNYIGLCPFHNEKTPSFSVSPSKGIFKCFGCGKAGNVVGFLMEHEHFNFPESLRFLAEKYHIPIEEDQADESDRASLDKQDSLYIVNQYALHHFQNRLFESEEGKTIGLSYLKERGFLEETLKAFQIGYSLNKSDDFSKTAMEAGHRLELLKELGLVKDYGDSLKDFFKGRIIFPIRNLSGKPIAFAGRVMGNNVKAPKYINSPETPVYEKGKTLFGIDMARTEIRKHDECLLVEGYTDVMSLHQYHIRNVVASSGTSLTEDQVRLIKRFTKHVTILYDGDQAGIKAAIRGVDIVLKQGLTVYILMLPEEHDPDSFIRKSGTDEFKKYLQKNKQDFILFKTKEQVKSANNDPAQLSLIIHNVVDSIAVVPDPIQRSLYVRECAHLMHLDENMLVNEVRKKIRKILYDKGKLNTTENQKLNELDSSKQIAPRQASKTDQFYFFEKKIIRLILSYGDKIIDHDTSVVSSILSNLDGIRFKHPVYDQLLELIRQHYHASDHPVFTNFYKHHADDQIRNACIELMTDSNYELSKNWSEKRGITIPTEEDNYVNDVISCMTRYNFLCLSDLIDRNNEAMKTESDIDKLKQLVKEHQILLDKRSALGERLNIVIVSPDHKSRFDV